MVRVRSLRPFEQMGVVLMPDHLHLLWRLPDGDSDFSSRIGAIKQCFTRLWLAGGGEEGSATPGRARQQYRGVWQKRFYEHWIRDYRDFKLHLDYIHINPVKHGLAARPGDWPWSSFQRYVRRGEYDADWCGRVELPGCDIEPDGW